MTATPGNQPLARESESHRALVGAPGPRMMMRISSSAELRATGAVARSKRWSTLSRLCRCRKHGPTATVVAAAVAAGLRGRQMTQAGSMFRPTRSGQASEEDTRNPKWAGGCRRAGECRPRWGCHRKWAGGWACQVWATRTWMMRRSTTSNSSTCSSSSKRCTPSRFRMTATTWTTKIGPCRCRCLRQVDGPSLPLAALLGPRTTQSR
mmetsp:Transcript_21759/g.51658  ORF Transcript_21759/g.51658 Transcript_21759/m.51658 type:complete len:208 (-) Transcript_21759:514-1137(-)